MNPQTKKLIIFLSVIAFLLIFFSLIVPLIFPSLKVEKTAPSDQETGVDLQVEISATFNRQPQKENLSLKITPSLEFDFQVNKNLLTISTPQPLNSNTTYQVEVFYQEKSLFSWVFTTRGKTEAEAIEEEMVTTQESYPFINHLPYTTPSFKITYEAPKALKIYLKGDNPELVKEQALSWLESKNLDLSTHTINWVPQP